MLEINKAKAAAIVLLILGFHSLITCNPAKLLTKSGNKAYKETRFANGIILNPASTNAIINGENRINVFVELFLVK